jgi:hypothetical protein
MPENPASGVLVTSHSPEQSVAGFRKRPELGS